MWEVRSTFSKHKLVTQAVQWLKFTLSRSKHINTKNVCFYQNLNVMKTKKKQIKTKIKTFKSTPTSNNKTGMKT